MSSDGRTGRDNFSAATKVALAKRVGYRCSYPSCNANTIGPSDESAEATASTGEAAHISAAAGGPGARRYRSGLTPEQRSSIDNGIWCCNYHAKLIDTDEVIYTIPMLRQWKALAERRAQLRQAHGDKADAHWRELVTVGLAPDSVTLLSGGEISSHIGASVRHACLSEIYGQEVAHAVRDFLIEYARNALTHGCALTVEIAFASNLISVIDDGSEFSACTLSGPHARGGGMAYKAMLENKHLGYISSRRLEGQNQLRIPIVVDPRDLPRVNPCAITVSSADIREGKVSVSKVSGCDRIFVVAREFAVYSDGPVYARILRDLAKEHPNIVLIVPEASPAVLTHYRQLLPEVPIVAW